MAGHVSLPTLGLIQHFKKTHSLLLPDYIVYRLADILTDVNSLEWIATQVLAAIEQHAPGRVYVVGHSMGGAIALLLAHIAPKLLSGVMVIDSSLIMSSAKRDKFTALGKAILTRHGHQVMSDFIDDYMINHELDDLPIMQSKKKEMLSVHARAKDLLARLITDAAMIKLTPTIKKLQHGVYIAAHSPLVSKKEIEKINQHIICQQIESCGHFVMLNAAAELNAIITDCIA